MEHTVPDRLGMIRFGTDGVRGLANAELTPELVMALGRTAARVLGQPEGGPDSQRWQDSF